jgi:hypothetical protein
VRMLYVLHSIEHGRPLIHRARSPLVRPRNAVSSARSHRRAPHL